MAKQLKLVMGLQSVRAPRYTSESDYVKLVNAQMKEVMDDLQGILTQFEDATPEIVVEALEPTFEKSKAYCPKDTHALVNSGYLEIISTGKKPYVEMGYAKGGKPRYAPYVHEIPNKHAAPTRWKWLQAAIEEDMGQIASRIGSLYAKFLSRKQVGRNRGRKRSG